MGYATISQFRTLTNLNKSIVNDPTLKSIFLIADRLINKLISTQVYEEQLDGDIDGSNKYYYTSKRPICDITLKNVTLLDDCDTADWTDSTDAVADALGGKFVYGNSSVMLGKDGTASATATYTKTAGATVDGTDRKLKVTIYIKSVDNLAEENALELRIGNTDTDYYAIKYNRSELKNGLNEFSILLTDMGSTGTPDIETLDYMFIGFITLALTDTVTSGDWAMDYWRLEDINSPDTDDVTVNSIIYDTQDRAQYVSHAVTAITARSGRIELTTAPTKNDNSSTGAEGGVYADYSYTSPNTDWELINPASCYMAAHLVSLKVSGSAPNYGSIEEGFMRRDLAGAPDEWLRLCYSLITQAIGEDGGIGFRTVEVKDK